jgi:hypothetical protein
VVFGEKPVHVLKFLDILDSLPPNPAHTQDSHNSLPSEKDPPGPPTPSSVDQAYPLAAFNKVYNMLTSFLVKNPKPNPLVRELVTALQDAATKLFPFRQQLSELALQRFSNALLLIKTHQTARSYEELRSTLANIPSAHPPESKQPGIKLAESINTSIHLTEDGPSGRKASHNRAISLQQSRRSIQATNCIVSFKDLQNSESKEIEPQKRTLPLREKEVRAETPDSHSVPANKKEISFRSFDNHHTDRETPSKAPVEPQTAPDRIVLALIESERQRYKKKIKDLKAEMTKQKEDYEKEISLLKEKIVVLESGKASSTVLKKSDFRGLYSSRFDSEGPSKDFIAKKSPRGRAFPDFMETLETQKTDSTYFLDLNFQSRDQQKASIAAPSSHTLKTKFPSAIPSSLGLENSIKKGWRPSGDENERALSNFSKNFPFSNDRNASLSMGRKNIDVNSKRLVPSIAELAGAETYLADFNSEIEQILGRRKAGESLGLSKQLKGSFAGKFLDASALSKKGSLKDDFYGLNLNFPDKLNSFSRQ